MADKISSTKDFRHDINVLRTIAVLGVVLFHYNIGHFGGGFAGVDIFFVISGYLMTRIIITGIDKGRFSFADFYGRRLKRIVPALLFMLIAVTVAGFFFYFPDDYQENEKNAAASALFLSNILYWKSTNYFAPASGDNVLLHTWSLSVEWQFYLLYPVLLMGLCKAFKNKKQHLVVFIITMLLSFAGAVWWTNVDPTASFYLLPARAWEMLFGGIAFLGQDYLKSARMRIVLALVGYLIIGYCLVFFRSNMPWPGVYTIVPVLATFMIIIANYNFRLLNFPGVQFIGKISYSLYLWHWPIFVMATYAGVDIGITATAVIALAAFVMACLSYYLVESRNYQSSPLVLAGGAVTLAATACLALFTSNAIIFKPSTVKISAYKTLSRTESAKKRGKRSQCWISSHTDDYSRKECLALHPIKRNVLLMGDSHAMQFSTLFRDEFEKRNINILQATASGCMAVRGTKGKKECAALMDYVFEDFVKNNPEKIHGVILCGNWVNRFGDSTKLLSDLKNTITYLQHAGIKAVVIGQNETYSMEYPYVSARENEYNVKLDDKYLTKNSYYANNFLKRNLKDNYVDVYTYNKEPKVKDGIPYMSDRNHLSVYGARLAMKKILAHPGFAGLLNQHLAPAAPLNLPNSQIAHSAPQKQAAK